MIYDDKANREKPNGQTVFLSIRPSNCVFEKTLINKDRTKLLTKRGEQKLKATNIVKFINHNKYNSK